MISHYNLSSADTKRSFGVEITGLSACIIIILCQLGSFLPSVDLNPGHPHSPAHIFSSLMDGSGMGIQNSFFSRYLDGPKPQAINDSASTPEETSVVIDVLANDVAGNVGDGDAEDVMEAQIDKATVDLDPAKKGIQNTRASLQGMYAVNNVGQVTFTPALNFFGLTSIQYTVNSKGEETSNNATISLTVTNINDAPFVTGQNPVQLTTPEGQALTITLNNLIITDPDNLPGDFTLEVLPGTNYTVSGNMVTPDAGFSGPLPVSLTVGDGITSSEVFTLDVMVTKANAKPIITGQSPSPLLTSEDQSITISLNNLQVSDVDDAYPTGFTLMIGEGLNYTVSGQTVIPALNFSGTLSVPVTVNDGEANSDPINVQISVTPVNDAPVISGQTPLNTQEDNPLTITLSNLTATDPDHAYPTGFSLKIQAGNNYSVSENVITPAANFSGTLVVPVVVNDGTSDSAPFNLQVAVTAVNDAPVITAQTPLNTNENTALTLTLSNLTVTDPDNSYPTGFSLKVKTGNNYSVSGNVITPSTNFSGTLVVPVVVNDGSIDSAPFDLQITVKAVNDAPVITGQTLLSTQEDNPLTITLSNLTVTDSDNTYPTGFSLKLQPGSNYTVSGNTVTPSINFSGTLVVPVVVNDGTSDSAPFNLQVSVTAVNDAPVITAQTPLSTNENTALTITLSNLTVTDVDNTYPTGFSLKLQPGSNYAVSGNTVTPTTNFSGTLLVPVVVNDGTSDSGPFELRIAVKAVNDAPVITGQTLLSTQEDNPLTITLSNLTVTDSDNTYPTGFSLKLQAGDNYSINGSVITPAANFSGNLVVPVVVNDGTSDSAPFNLQVSVTAVNDAPVITAQTPLSTNENTALTITLSNLTVTDPDNSYPTGFSLKLQPGSNYAVSGNTVTPTTNFSGTLLVPVVVNDGTSDSGPFELRIAVKAVNDAPVITGQTVLSTQEDNPLTITLSNLTVTDSDNTYPTGFTLKLQAGDNYSINGGVITPAANFSGNLVVPVVVNDGTSDSAPFNLQVSVTAVNDVPVITAQTPLSTNENTAITITLSNLTVTDSDNTYPTGFSLKLQAGDNYSVSGSVITPAANFAGTLSVPVVVNDGSADSAPFNLQITVNAVNNAPVITGQTPLSTSENTAITITLSNLTVTDPDNSYPTGFSLKLQPGNNYSVSGSVVTPSTNFSGTLVVPVKVNDGTSDSAPFDLQITVTAVNDAPVITGQTPLNTEEDNSLTITLSNLIVTDSDNTYPTGFSLKLQPGDNYVINGSVITPSTNFSGTLVVPVVVNDGTSDSAPFNLQITVTAVNDPPVITAQTPLSTPENQTIALNLSHLTVEDPDNNYPADFSLSVFEGANYTVSGNLITPANGFNGILSVAVLVNDGSDDSPVFTVAISVNATNDAPVITGQKVLTMTEDNSIIIALQDVIVTDPDNTYPNGFTLTVLPGANYIFNGTTVTPVLNFTGTLSVNVTVNDGMSESQPFALQIAVSPVNDAPVIESQLVLVTEEDVPRTIEFSDLNVSDPDNAYPAGFRLLLSSGDNYTISGNNVVPALHFSGNLTIPVQVNDGLLNSNIFNLLLQVNAVNDAPEITGQTPVSTEEDTPVTILLSNLTVLDVDNPYPTGFSLSISPGANYSVSGFTVLPSLNFTGTLNVGVTVNDGISNSAPFSFQIQVGESNDPPVITGQVAVNTDEEAAFTLELSHLLVTDPDNPYPTGFSLVASPGLNYTVSGQVITPALNFSGVLTIPLRVNDGINNSATFNFQLQVNQVNDPPAFAAIPNQKISENAPPGSIAISGISKGPLEEFQQLNFVATSSNTNIINNPSIQYDGTSSQGLLTYSVNPNASGIVTITIVAIDNGSNTSPNQNTYSSSFQIEVTEINTAPTLDPINNISLIEDAEQQNIALTGIGPGPGESQTISLSVSSNKSEYFDLLDVVYVSPQSTGLIRFKPKANFFGTVQVTVTITDNGSGISPNVNTFARSFNVVIQPVNDPPVFTSAPGTLAVINEVYEYTIEVVDPDNDPVTIGAVVKPVWATFTAISNGKALLRGTPPPSVLGNFPVQIQAKDASTAVDQTFTIYVNVRPTISPLSIVTEEDTPVMLQTNFFTNGYTDLNGNALEAILITSTPVKGRLMLADKVIKRNDTLSASTLSRLVYTPDPNYFGMDSFGWKASDGFHFSLSEARVSISVLSINDPPVIIFKSDTLLYEVDGESALLASLIEISDPDDDTLTHAEIGFYARNFRPEVDILEFQNTTRIRGVFDFQAGILRFSGAAPLAEYIQAIRSIKYLHQNTFDPILEPKTLYFTLDDGEDKSEPKDKIIILQYTFIEFNIPTGFTPNGDQANDTWIIDRPGGGIEEMDNAVISVYNKQGILVFRTRGFDKPWDGKMNGEFLPADTYFFTIDLQLRSKKTYKGTVTLLR